MDVWSYEAGRDKKWKNKDNESGGNRKESPGKEVEVLWACDEERGALRREEGDGSESTREKEERKVGQSEGWYQGEGTVGWRSVRPCDMEVYVIVHGPHIKVGIRWRRRRKTYIGHQAPCPCVAFLQCSRPSMCTRPCRRSQRTRTEVWSLFLNAENKTRKFAACNIDNQESSFTCIRYHNWNKICNDTIQIIIYQHSQEPELNGTP